MPDYGPLALKAACAILALLVARQAARIVLPSDALGRATLPDVPTWSPPTNSPSAPGTPAGSPGQPSMPPGMPPGMVPGMIPGMPPGMPPGRVLPSPSGRSRGGAPAAPLSPEAQARLDRIVQSGLLGPVIRPPPMALLGIVGSQVLLRAPTGQTGLVREGDELGGIKVVRIGTNRVLVLENDQPKELSIFGGLGGDSLLTPAKQGTP